MAARVTAEAVKEIISTSIANDTLDTNHIDTANTYVDDVLAGAGLSDAILEKIELYLAAHFVALTEEGGALTRKRIGEADESYADVFKGGLHMTRFGQAALALDSTGTLVAAAQTQLKATFRVV